MVRRFLSYSFPASRVPAGTHYYRERIIFSNHGGCRAFSKVRSRPFPERGREGYSPRLARSSRVPGRSHSIRVEVVLRERTSSHTLFCREPGNELAF